MSDARLHAAAGLAIVRRDVLLFLSYRLRLVTQLAAIFLNVALFYYVSRLVNVQRFPAPDSYFAYVVVGLTGTFERLVVSPLGPVGSVVAMSAFPALLAFVVAS